MFRPPNAYRVRTGPAATTDAAGPNGCFIVPVEVPHLKAKQNVFVIAGDGMGWEHVSVSRKDRVPTWDEMCQVKALFWDDEDCVVQYHPPKSEYVNVHPNCLHLWRPKDAPLPVPPKIMVG